MSPRTIAVARDKTSSAPIVRASFRIAGGDHQLGLGERVILDLLPLLARREADLQDQQQDQRKNRRRNDQEDRSPVSNYSPKLPSTASVALSRR